MHFNHGNPIFKSYFTIISITPSPKKNRKWGFDMAWIFISKHHVVKGSKIWNVINEDWKKMVKHFEQS
jgi:hypothetical protein